MILSFARFWEGVHKSLRRTEPTNLNTIVFRLGWFGFWQVRKTVQKFITSVWKLAMRRVKLAMRRVKLATRRLSVWWHKTAQISTILLHTGSCEFCFGRQRYLHKTYWVCTDHTGIHLQLLFLHRGDDIILFHLGVSSSLSCPSSL